MAGGEKKQSPSHGGGIFDFAHAPASRSTNASPSPLGGGGGGGSHAPVNFAVSSSLVDPTSFSGGAGANAQLRDILSVAMGASSGSAAQTGAHERARRTSGGGNQANTTSTLSSASSSGPLLFASPLAMLQSSLSRSQPASRANSRPASPLSRNK